MKTLTKKVRELLEENDVVGVKVFVSYFTEGDYTDWYDRYIKETGEDISYKEWVEKVLIPEMKKYDEVVLYSDGCLYGIKNGITYDISYSELPDEPDHKTFIEIAEKYGYEIA